MRAMPFKRIYHLYKTNSYTSNMCARGCWWGDSIVVCVSMAAVYPVWAMLVKYTTCAHQSHILNADSF